MLIDCPGCTKSYHISREMLEPNGRTVACPRCSATWFVAAEVAGSDSHQTIAPEISTEAVSRRAAAVTEPAKPQPPMGKQGKQGSAAREYPPPPSLRMSGFVLLGLAALGLAMAALGCRNNVVRVWPQAATAYAWLGLPINLRGLALHDVHMTQIDAGPAIGIEGKITNLKPGKNAVPALRLSLRDAQSHEVYVWTTEAPKSHLSAGETLTFHASLAAPPANVEALLVSFAPAARDGLTLQH